LTRFINDDLAEYSNNEKSENKQIKEKKEKKAKLSH